MNILEKEIEDIVFESDNPALNNRGLPIKGVKFRQLNLGAYGIADIVAVDIARDSEGWSVNIQVVELKKELIDVNTLMQCARYSKAISIMINKFFNLNCNIKISHILIGKSIQQSGDFVFLLDAMPNASAYTFSIDLEDGILFSRKWGYSMSMATVPNPTIPQLRLLKRAAQIAVIDKNTEPLPF